MADNTYTVKITTQAEEQLQEIVKYIASELKAPKAALRLLNEMERSISNYSMNGGEKERNQTGKTHLNHLSAKSLCK